MRQCTAAASDNAPSSCSGSVYEAWSLLKEATALDARGRLAGSPLVGSRGARDRLRAAVLDVRSNSVPAAGWDPSREPLDLIMGVVASDIWIGARALRDYCSGLGVPFVVPASRVQGVDSVARIGGPVYLKYIVASALCYASQYQGRDRGVLLQFGQEQVGHLPLGLFDEDMRNPPPELP